MPIRVVPQPSDPRRPVAAPLWRELVGSAVRARRLQRGLRLRDVAERAGISAQYLSEVERGRKDPSSEMLESICGALGLDLLDLVHAVGTRLGRIELGTRLGRIEVGSAGRSTIGVAGPVSSGCSVTAMVRAAA